MISEKMIPLMKNNSAIRMMFEEGNKLAAKYGRENVFDFSLGNPSVPAPAEVNQAIQDIVKEEDSLFVHGYMSNAGYEDVRETIAQSLNRRFGTSFHAGNILMTVGAASGLNVILKTLLNPGEQIITFAPYFVEYGSYVRNYDGELVVVSPNTVDFQPNLVEFEEKINEKTKAVIINTPNNPTGLLPERGLLEAIAQRCRALNISLILDEAFLDFIPDQPGFIPLLAQHPHVWVLRSLTKFYAIPGLRLGYLLNADAQAVARLRARQMPWSINAYAALAGEIILQDRAYQRATWQWLQEEGARFYAQLQEMAGLTVWPGRANYLFLRCDRADFDLQYALLRQHVLIRSCANYPGLDSRYFRVAIRSAEENDQLLAALRRVLA